ncbi:anti-sigma factor family protein [Novosphingobium naphthalenivorans]|uniref:anti-sigma factor family protein n=1 Tax=Novosphingobium naphthalenivorans TaxID=273168 RepID=UPI00082CE337|nr:anti-sigma factor [Novosphingobium naphthalenivorans]
MTQRPITEDDLQAYVDEALDPERRAAVAAFLTSNPEIEERVAMDLHHRRALREALAPVAKEPLPARLNLARLAEERGKSRFTGWTSVAAALALMLAGGAGGWSLRLASERPAAGIGSLAQEAADSYAVFAPDLGRPVEIGASDEAQLVRWASRRLDRAVKVPNLSAAGYTFLGGRVVPTPHGPAALYMYDNGSGTRLVMLTRNMAIDKNAPMATDDRGAVATVSWARDGLGYSLVGPLSPRHLHSIADQARAQSSGIS